MANAFKIYLAPLQGYTDKIFRDCYLRHFFDVDQFFTPYLTVEHLTKHQRLSVCPDWDTGNKKTVPQILPASIEELKLLTGAVVSAGFKQMNINLGCPYPMVTNKGRGASLIAKPELVASFLQFVAENTDIQISIKTRLGIKDENEILKLLEILCPFPMHEVIVHARTAVQMYKGKVSVLGFEKCIKAFPQLNFVYNGDIFSYEDFASFEKLFPDQNRWMIGRGILQNPFLPWQIKNRSKELPSNSLNILQLFIEDWINCVEASSNDRNHALNRVQNQFIYLHHAFPDFQRARRLVRKARSLEEIKRELVWLYL
jgi:tRNA-dihydrouridine synthase B